MLSQLPALKGSFACAACQVEEDEQPETAIFKLDEKQVEMLKKLRETTT